MSKRIRVTDESVNSYGFWIKTSGIDLTDFLKNPIMLWNHSRSWRGTEDELLPIGVWKDLEVKGSEMSAMPDIDQEDAFAARIAKKFGKGHLMAASIGVQIVEWSEDPALFKPGQTRATVTKCRLREISLVDIPSNKNAIVLYDQDGEILNLSDSGALPNLPTINPKPETTVMEELKSLALSLGLLQTATLAEVQAKIEEFKGYKAKLDSAEAELKKFKDEQADARKAEVKSLLDAAVAEGRVQQGQRGAYEKLFDADFESAKAVLALAQKHVKLSDFAAPWGSGGGSATASEGKTFSQLSKESPNALARLKEENVELFKQMYKAEYGKEYRDTPR